jgi:hypothetical protein
MMIIRPHDLERLVRATFPQKAAFCVATELAATHSRPLVGFVHGGADPHLDPHFDAWLTGAPRFVSAFELLNRLCLAGALPPGEYALQANPLP